MIDDKTPQTPAYNLRKRQNNPSTTTSNPNKPKAKSKVEPKKKAAANYESDFEPDSDSQSSSASEASVEEYDSDDYALKTETKKVKKTTTSTRQASASTAANTTAAQSVKKANKPVRDNAPIHIDLGADEVQDIREYHKKIETPFWLKPETMMDKNKKMMHEEDYDPTSVFIPEREFKRLSGLQQRYWDIKKNHFDQMVLFKFGVFYYIYHDDALIAHKLLDLRLNVWGKRFSVFFHETHLKKYATKIVEQGHKVAVVEQMENSHTKEDEYAKREVVQVLTRGTYAEGVDQGYSPRFCLCLFERENQGYGIVFLDTTTHEFYLGEFQEDIHKGTLKTLLTRLKPMEIVYLQGNLSEETLMIVKSLSSKPTLNPIHNKDTLGLDIIVAKIEKYFQVEFPEVLDNMRIVVQNAMDSIKKLRKKDQRHTAEQKIAFYSTLQAVSLCLTFLERIMLAETVFKMGNFYRYDVAVEKKSSLYLDGQALESLEIFEVGYLTSTNVNNNNGSLFDYMDKTATDFGKRMLRRWMMTPLLDPIKISERHDAVEDLVCNPEELDLFQACLKRLPDIERSVNRVYNLSNKKRMAAHYFEDFAKNRLRDFLLFLEELEKIDDMMKSFQASAKGKFNSKRLKQLITFRPEKKKVSMKKKSPEEQKVMEIGTSKEEQQQQEDSNAIGVFPSISPLIKELKDMVMIVDGLPMPAEGTNDETDKIMKNVKKVKTTLAGILDHERKYYGYKSVNYVHTKYRYELEIPEAIIKASKRPDNYVITSKRQGFLRFHTPKIEECIQELEEHERELQKVLVDFIVGYFKKFYENNLTWRQVVTCLGELDCICSLARLATTMNIKCRPTVLNQAAEGEKNVFVLKDMVHPSLAAQMEREARLEELSKAKSQGADVVEQQAQDKKKKKKGKKEAVTAVSQQTQNDSTKMSNPNTIEEAKIQERFVRNDVVREDGMDVFLITGPNMGGKSTLLRQTALAVVMAQMGSMVPAKEFTFNVVDRVFTRIGAGDKIFEGKSTFFLEMEETGNIVKEATKNSLLVMDELGRGTSTYDGVSLAFGTLKFVAEKIKCLTLFATHYHILLEEFQLYKNVKKYFMLSHYNEATEDLKFTYKFIEGHAERSHSYVIAKMAGLPQEMLKSAKERALMLTKEKENMDRASAIEKDFNKAILALKSFKRDKEGVKDPEDFLKLLEGLSKSS